MRAIPLAWMLLAARGALLTHYHYTRLSPQQRRRLRELAAKSRGWPANLTAAERRELGRIVADLDVRNLGRGLAALASPLPWPRKPKRRK